MTCKRRQKGRFFLDNLLVFFYKIGYSSQQDFIYPWGKIIDEEEAIALIRNLLSLLTLSLSLEKKRQNTAQYLQHQSAASIV